MSASDNPKVVHLIYSCEAGSWAVESEQMPSLFAGGDSFEDAKALAHQVVHDEFGDALTVFHWPPVPDGLKPVVTGETEPVIASRAGATVSARPTSRPLDLFEPLLFSPQLPSR
jgi:hypothetical protein